jgi:maleate cis-trans isomerase
VASAPDSRGIAREFLSAIAGVAAASRPIGLRVPSVLSNSASPYTCCQKCTFDDASPQIGRARNTFYFNGL